VNEDERRVYDALTARGYQVLRNGWPDFLVVDRKWDEAFAVEWKACGDRLRDHQELMHRTLGCHFGIETLVTGRLDEILGFRPRFRDELMTGYAVRIRDRLRGESFRLEQQAERLRNEITQLRAAGA
jgi:hypothetical protein